MEIKTISDDLDTIREQISPDDNDAMEAIDRITRALNEQMIKERRELAHAPQQKALDLN